MNTRKYFEEIGAWPHDSRHIARAYVIGFLLSLLLTFAAYFAVTHQLLSQTGTIALIIFLALSQFVIQIICFLHLGRERSSRDRLIVLGAAALIVTILVSGSIWILYSLNERQMPDPVEMQQYMADQGGF